MDYRKQNIQENVDCIMKWFWVYVFFKSFDFSILSTFLVILFKTALEEKKHNQPFLTILVVLYKNLDIVL